MLQVSENEIKDRLRFDNPWWEGKGIGQRLLEMPRRAYLPAFQALATNREVRRAVILMGPRRVGKTVMLHHSIHEQLEAGVTASTILYLSLDTPIYTGIGLEKMLRLFMEIHSHPLDAELTVIFDEIQYLKDWEVHLKSLVDSYPNTQFIASGSAAAALRLKSHESGAGRFTDFMLPPLTFAEYLGFIGEENNLIIQTHDIEDSFQCKNIDSLNDRFIEYLNFGGYPEAVFNEQIRNDPVRYIKNDIVDKVLLRDLPSLYGIQDIQELNRLFTTIAYNSGQEVNLEGLSKSSGVAKNTIKRYLEYLEAAFLIRRINRIDENAQRFKRITHFKVYLTNPSIRSALFGPLHAEHAAIGSMVETAIFSQWMHSEYTIGKLHYARWKGGEIDIVKLDSGGASVDWSVEIKWSDLPYTNISKLKSVIQFYKTNKVHISEPLVTSKNLNEKKLLEGITIRFCPSSLYCYTVGKNITTVTDFELLSKS